MADVLPLLGDGDEIGLLRAVETAFGVRLTRNEAERCGTVGDLHGILLSRVRHQERGSISCATAAAFRRLRRAIRKRNPQQTVRPDSVLSTFATGRAAGNWWACLAKESGLRLPNASVGYGGLAVLGAIASSPLLAYPFVGQLAFVGLLLSVPIGVVTGLRMRIHPLARYRTVGELARVAAAMNISSLSWPAGAMRTRDIWSALEAIIREELHWEGPLGPETRFFAPR